MIFATFSQPAHTAADQAALGVNTFFRWEPENDSNHVPTVPLATWKTIIAPHCNYIAQPSPGGILTADANDTNLTAWLQPQDEIDNAIVNRQGAGDGAGVAALYAAAEATYAACKAASAKPVCCTVDLWQAQWGKVDYGRIFAAADWLWGDFYQIKMNATVDQLKERVGWLQTQAKGKRVGAFLNSSWINDAPQYWPKDRAPTPDEVVAQLNLFRSMGVDVCDFPQSFNPFVYDGRSDAVKAAIKGWCKPSPAPSPPTTKGPLDGAILQSGGYSYILTAK